MQRYRSTSSLVCAVFLLAAGTVRAGTLPDPLRLVPAEAELVFKIEDPRTLARTIYDLDAVQDVLKIDSVRELYESTNARRAYQLLAYFEKQLGRERFDLLDQLAGGGIVVAAKFTGSPSVLAVLQARDEKMLRRFVELGLVVIDQELARHEIKGRPEKRTYHTIETVQIDKVHFAITGSALLVSSDAKLLHHAIDCHFGRGKSIADVKSLKDARRSLSAKPHAAWVWLDMKKIQTIQAYREGVKTITLQPVIYFVIGPMFDVVERSPYVAAGFYHTGKTFGISVRMPQGRDGLPPKAKLFLPEANEGTLPLLNPPHTLASFSYHLDLGKLWEHKDQWLSNNEAKELGDQAKKVAPFMGGIQIGKLLQQLGTHHRLIISQPDTRIGQSLALNTSALVVDMRDPAFGKSIESVLRAAGLIGSFQFNLKMVEEKRGPYTIVSYHFSDKQKTSPEVTRLLSSYSPSFVTVGDQFIVAATLDLARELVDLVSKEKRQAAGSATSHFQVLFSGVAAGIRSGAEQLRTQFILGQAQSPSEADRQARELVAVIERLGTIDFQIRYGAKDFRYDIRLKMAK